MNSTTDHSAEGPAPEPPPAQVPPPAEPETIRRRGKRYQRIRAALSAVDWGLEVLLLFALLDFGWTLRLRDVAERQTDNPWLVVLLYLLPLGLVFGAISMAFSAIRTFVVDRRFGLSNESFGGWLLDQAKSFAVGGALAFILIEILYAMLRAFPATWWLWTAAVFSLLLIFFAHVAPVLIFPIFFKFRPIADEEITGRLKRLAERAGTRIKGIYEVNFSRKTRAANAALVGFGRTRRIILADNLLDRFSLDEIETVIAHELAHHTQRHLPKGMLLQTAMFFALFYGIHLVLVHVGPRFGFERLDDAANFPLVTLAGTIFGLVLLPLTNGILRRFEREADAYALRMATRPEAFLAALKRLAQINLADPTPNAIVEWIFYSHPSIRNRLRMAETMLEDKKGP